MSRLAPDPVVVHLDGVALVLRPTLKAAIRLDRREGGFAALTEGILDGDMGAIADTIEEAADHPTAIVALLKDVAVNGVERLLELRDPLITYLGQLLGADETEAKDTGKPDPHAKTITRAEHLRKLFEIGTGYIGWTPAETLAASPAEIEAAYRGRVDLLKSIFGGSDEPKPDTSIPLSKRVAATMKALGAKVVKREKAST
jgi:hypothetical protein